MRKTKSTVICAGKISINAILLLIVMAPAVLMSTVPTLSLSTAGASADKMPEKADVFDEKFYSTDTTRVSDQVMDVAYSQVRSDSSSEVSGGALGNLKPESPGTITIKGTLKYWDEWGAYNPVRRVRVILKDDDTGPDETVTSQWSDYSGRFSFTVNNDDGIGQDGRDPYIRIESENPYAKCRPGIEKIYYWELPKCGNDVPDGFYYDYGTRTLDGTHAGKSVLQILDAVLTEALWIYNRVAWTRHQLNVYYPSDGPQFHYWDGIVEHIDLPDSRHSHPTVHHEYGHAVLYQLYEDSVPSGSGPDPHNPTSESSGGFALREGWAEFMECAVENDPNHVTWDGHNIETNDWYNHVDSGNMDGNIVEGSVASILWDIFDPVSAADKDDMSWGFEEIFTVMRYDHPSSMDSFWTKWITRWPTMSSSVGPLCTIYWNYGIDKDTYAPYSGSVSINAGATYTKSTSVTLTLSCSDWGSEARYMRFRNSLYDSWSISYTYATSKSWTLSSGDGTKTVYVQFIDWKGYASTTYGDSIVLDTVKPTGSITINYGNPTYTKTQGVRLYLTYSDATSGVDKVCYKNDGSYYFSAWETPTTTRVWSLINLEGTRKVTYKIMDRAGNTAEFGDTIILDTKSPTGSISINYGNPAETSSWYVTLYLGYSDATSGVSAVRYRNSDEPWTSWESPLSTKTWILMSGQGTKRVYYQVSDKAGWLSQIYYDEITLTTTKLSRAFFNLNPNPAAPGQSIRLMGFMTGPDGSPIKYTNVKVYYGYKGLDWTYLMTLMTNGSGIFSTTHLTASKSTFYHVLYSGDSTHPACGNTAYLAVVSTSPIWSPLSPLFFNVNPNPTKPYTTVKLEGILVQSSGQPIVRAEIKIYYSTNNGGSWGYLTTLTTDIQGMFSTSFNVKATTLFRVKYSSISITNYEAVI